MPDVNSKPHPPADGDHTPALHEAAVVHHSGALRLRFWTAFVGHMQATSTIRCAKPSVDGWMDHGADLNGGVLYSIMRTRLGEIGVQFALNDSTAATIYSWLLSRAPELETAFTDELTWHDPEAAQTSLIEVRRSVDLSDEARWPEYFDWLRSRLETFQTALWPIVGRVPPPQEAGRHWDEASFFAALSTLNPAGVATAREFLSMTEAAGFGLKWGRGRRYGSVTPRVVCRSQPYEPVSLWTSSVVVLRFVDLRKHAPWDDRERRLELVGRLNRVPHFALPDRAVDQRLALPIQMLDDPLSMARFMEALEWFREVSRSYVLR